MSLQITRIANASVRCDSCSEHEEFSSTGVRAVMRQVRASGWKFKSKVATCAECVRKAAEAKAA